MEADLNRLQSDTLTGRVYDPAVQRPLRRPAPVSRSLNHYPVTKATVACGAILPNCGGSLSYLGEDTAEQLELMRSAFRVIRTVREKHACTQCDAPSCRHLHLRGPSSGVSPGPGLLARVLTSKYAERPARCIASQKYTAGKVWS